MDRTSLNLNVFLFKQDKDSLGGVERLGKKNHDSPQSFYAHIDGKLCPKHHDPNVYLGPPLLPTPTPKHSHIIKDTNFFHPF